jgi:hypothetical protein
MRAPLDRGAPVGWGITLHPDGTVTAAGPDGRVLHSHGPPQPGRLTSGVLWQLSPNAGPPGLRPVRSTPVEVIDQLPLAVPELLPLFDGQVCEVVHDHFIARYIHHVAGVNPAPRAPGVPSTALVGVGVRRMKAIAVPADHRPAGDADSQVAIKAGRERPDLSPSTPARPLSSRCHVRHRRTDSGQPVICFRSP